MRPVRSPVAGGSAAGRSSAGRSVEGERRPGRRSGRAARIGLIALAAVAVVSCVVALVVGARPTAPASASTGCPDGLLDAVERGGVIAGTPGAIADVVPASTLDAPLTASLLRGCVIRVRYTYRSDTPISFEAFTVGGPGTAAALATALLRDGWLADDGPTTAFRRPDGGTATVDDYPAGRFATLLPSGFRLPSSSPYARAPVVVLGMTVRRSATSDARVDDRGCPDDAAARVRIASGGADVRVGAVAELGPPLGSEPVLAGSCVLVMRYLGTQSVVAVAPGRRLDAMTVEGSLESGPTPYSPTTKDEDQGRYGGDGDRWSVVYRDSGTVVPGLQSAFSGPTVTVVHETSY